MQRRRMGTGQFSSIQFPRIKRARDYYLYDDRGTRYLDCYQNGGLALLGHRPQKVLHEMKNVLSRGLLADYPSIYDYRLLKSLETLFPDYPEIRWYDSYEKTLTRLHELDILTMGEGLEEEQPILVDPAFLEEGDTVRTKIARYRPFLESATQNVSTIVPILPFPARLGITVVCSRERNASALPPSDQISPMFSAALTRTVYDLLSYRESVEKTVWCRFETEFWKRNGPYLVPHCGAGRYPVLFQQMMENKMLISPSPDVPSIVPAAFTEGDIACITAQGRISI